MTPVDYARLERIVAADAKDAPTLDQYRAHGTHHVYAPAENDGIDRSTVMRASYVAADLYLAARAHLFDLIAAAKERDALRALRLYVPCCDGCAIHGPERPHWHCACGISLPLGTPRCGVCGVSVLGNLP